MDVTASSAVSSKDAVVDQTVDSVTIVTQSRGARVVRRLQSHVMQIRLCTFCNASCIEL